MTFNLGRATVACPVCGDDVTVPCVVRNAPMDDGSPGYYIEADRATFDPEFAAHCLSHA